MEQLEDGWCLPGALEQADLCSLPRRLPDVMRVRLLLVGEPLERGGALELPHADRVLDRVLATRHAVTSDLRHGGEGTTCGASTSTSGACTGTSTGTGSTGTGTSTRAGSGVNTVDVGHLGTRGLELAAELCRGIGVAELANELLVDGLFVGEICE